MKVISIRQPWAALIVSGVKHIENRTWTTTYRGPLLIHAARAPSLMTDSEIMAEYGCVIPRSADQLGGVIGVVDLVDVAPPNRRRGKWHAEGHYGFVLAHPRPLRFVPMAGKLMLWEAPPELVRQLAEAA